MAIAITQCKGGVLLVDEIDTGLHYTVMAKMWKLIFNAAKQFDVQVFATTHSFDCVRSLAWLAKTQPDLCKGVRMHRVDSERSKTVVYGPEEISVAAEQHVEMRG